MESVFESQHPLMGGLAQVSDLIAAILVFSAACIGSIFIGRYIARMGPQPRRLALLTNLILMLTYLTCLWDRPILARIIPASALIIFSNWLPVFGSIFVGVCLGTTSITHSRRAVVSGIASCFIIYSLVSPMLGQTPNCRTLPASDTLLFQSTPHTCSAASAASLLRLHDIEASEAELAELCLTRQGTHWMGLYRGLMLKTEGTNWVVQVDEFTPGTIPTYDDSPAVFAFNINTEQSGIELEDGFQPNSGHSVVALEAISDNNIIVFDPAPDYGVEVWNADLFSRIRSGVVMRLVQRTPTTEDQSQVAKAVHNATTSRFAAR